MSDDDRIKRIREQGSTYLAQTHSEIGGRYSSVGEQTIVGADPITNYPAAAAHQCDPCGPEPPLSAYDNPAFQPSAVSAGSAGSAPSSTVSPLMSEHAGPSHRKPFRRY